MTRKPKRDKNPAVGLDLFGLMADRRESLQIRVRVDEPTRPDLQDDIKAVLGADPPPIVAGDTLNLDYKLEICYFGTVAKKLAAILNLADKGAVIQGGAAELQHGKSLILEVAALLQELPDYLTVKGERVEKIGYENEKNQGSD